MLCDPHVPFFLLLRASPWGWRLRLIDPVVRQGRHFYDGVVTLPYNPIAAQTWHADLISALLCLLELKTGDR
jgi:hypothetical protein